MHAPLMTGGGDVVTLFGHWPYAAGHVDCWFLQTRGDDSVSHVDIIAWQFVHCAPPKPQLPLEKPALHALPPQQPVQLFGLHGGAAHVPFEQICCCAWQLAHALPPMPQTESTVPPWQFPLPSQQPLQLFGPHFGGTFEHLPWSQNWFIPEQFWHWKPPRPHAVSMPPFWHWLPRQQPAQLFGPHACATHVCDVASHTWFFAVQSEHAPPLVPHASELTPEKHVGLPMNVPQHPLGHVLTSHIGVFLMHVCWVASHWSKPSAMQSSHFWPVPPHALMSVPSRHCPLASQHPVGQFAALHVPASPPSGNGPSVGPSVSPPSRCT